MCFVRLLITGDRHLGSVVIYSSCPSSAARSRLRFYNLMNISAPEQAAVQIIQIYLLVSRSLGDSNILGLKELFLVTGVESMINVIVMK